MPVNEKNIQVNDVVVFNISNQSRRYRGILTIKATVLKKENGFLFVVCGLDFYLVDVKCVYPVEAPVFFLYNMFGECVC